MGRNIRVVMLGAYPVSPDQVWGGVQAAYAYLVKGLSQVPDLDIHVLTFQPPGFSAPDQVKHGNYTLHLLPSYPPLERLRRYRTYQSILNQVLAQIRPDLIHVQDVAAEAFVALRSGYLTVMTVHGIRGEDRKYISSWRQQFRHIFDRLFIEKYSLSHTKHLIAISRYVRTYYQSILQPDINIYSIPNAVDEQFFHLPPSSQKNSVLFAGRVIPRKRVFDLVKAFAMVLKQIPDAQLRIAGEFSSEKAYSDSICRWIDQAGLTQHVHMLGPLPEHLVWEEFTHCNLLALPSIQETAPMVVAQAMAAGKAVVATRVGGVSEMVGDDGQRGLLVEVGDIAGLAQVLTHLLQDPGLLAQMGQSGRNFACQNYHMSRVAQQTAEAYESILSKE